VYQSAAPALVVPELSSICSKVEIVKVVPSGGVLREANSEYGSNNLPNYSKKIIFFDGSESEIGN
jgi:hypothetical protein